MTSDIVHVEVDSSEAVPEDPDFLAELEELAKSRYTDEDEEYMKVKNKQNSLPPIQLAYPQDRNRGDNRYRERRGYGQQSYNGYQRSDRNSGSYNQRSDSNSGSYNQRSDRNSGSYRGQHSSPRWQQSRY